MRSDAWIAGVAALAALAGLTAGLALMATRPPASTQPAAILDRLPQVEPGAGPLICLTRELVCAAPALPDGFPCHCQHPLRGHIAGRVTSVGEADEAIEEGGRRPPTYFDPDDLGGP
jgi:hypothetical protein